LFRFNNAQHKKKQKNRKKKQKNRRKKKEKKKKTKERKETGPAHTPRLGVRRLGRADQGGV
jgi:hypothetical protein